MNRLPLWRVLIEKIFDGYPVSGEYVEVFKNPTPKELVEIGEPVFRRRTVEVRAVIAASGVYVWDGRIAEHRVMMPKLTNIGKRIPVYINYNKATNSIEVRLSEYTYDTEYFKGQPPSNYKIATMLNEFPRFNKQFRNVFIDGGGWGGTKDIQTIIAAGENDDEE